MHCLYFAFITGPLFNMLVCVVLGQVYTLTSHPRLPFILSKQSEEILLGFLSYSEELKHKLRDWCVPA